MTAQRNKIDLDALREITDLILSRATPPRRVRGEHQEQKVDDCLLAISSETLDEKEKLDPSII